MEALELHFSKHSTWIFPQERVSASASLAVAPLHDLSDRLDEVLAKPLNFPALDQALVPGDQLVLAVDPSLPALIDVVAATANWFHQRGTAAENIKIVLGADGSWDTQRLRSAIEERCGLSLEVEQHNADNPDQLAYVAANEDSDPIYLNRSLVDADVVIPLSTACSATAFDYLGPFGLFPLLSDRATRGRFLSLPTLQDPAARNGLQAWADQAAWWVGIVVGIQIIPAGRDRISAILAGALASLDEAVQPLVQPTAAVNSDLTTNSTSGLVLAVIDSPPEAQSWLAVARALDVARRFVAPSGAIVLATNLTLSIGKGLGRLRDPHQSAEAIAKKLASDSSDDALAAAVLQQISQQHHVYLISDLRSDTVESLGMGAIVEPAQFERLLDQFPSTTIVEGAQQGGPLSHICN